jgi:hypothetical protein
MIVITWLIVVWDKRALIRLHIGDFDMQIPKSFLLPFAAMFIVGCILGTSGCTAAYVAGITASPDKKYSVSGDVRGAYGKAFSDYTWKTVWVEIYEGPSTLGDPLLSRKYRVQGSDVCWDAKWDEYDNVTFTIFDYGRGVDRYDARKEGIAMRQIQTIIYQLDSRSNSFAEHSTKD